MQEQKKTNKQTNSDQTKIFFKFAQKKKLI